MQRWNSLTQQWLDNIPGSYTPVLGGHNIGAAPWRKNAFTKQGMISVSRHQCKSPLACSDKDISRHKVLSSQYSQPFKNLEEIVTQQTTLRPLLLYFILNSRFLVLNHWPSCRDVITEM